MKNYKILIIFALVALAGGVLFLARMYRHDARALEGFVASYEKFDRAMADFSVSKSNDTEVKAIDALAGLNAKADFRLSSLIKNDALIPPVAREIAGIAGDELNALDTHKRSTRSKNAGGDRNLVQEYGNLTAKRKALYAHLQNLAGIE